jgi:CcmD family protein
MTPDLLPDTFPSLFWSYTITWLILAAYIWSLGARISRIERKLPEDKEQQ